MKPASRFSVFLLSILTLFSLTSSAFASTVQPQNESDYPGRFEIAPETISSPFTASGLNALSNDGFAQGRDPLLASIPLLVIVSEFAPSDGNVSVENDYTNEGYLRWPWRSYYAETWSDMFFAQNASIMDYYSVMSGGRFTFTPAPDNEGTPNDGVVFVTVKGDHPSYDANNDQWLSGKVYPGTENETNSYVGYSVRDAIEEAASCGFVNFTQFDRNNDRTVDRTELIVYNIIAGYEDINPVPDNAPKIYAHQYTISSATTTYDEEGYHSGTPACVGADSNGEPIYLDNYMITGERTATDSNYEDFVPPVYSIIAHELGHSLGLPDLYDTENVNAPKPQVGSLSNMADCYGSTYDPADPDGEVTKMPTALDPWSRAYLSFQTPTDAQPNTSYTLHSLGSGSPYNILKIETSDPNEYYLVENRQYESYDRGLETMYLRKAAASDDTAYKPGVVVWRIRGDIVEQYLGNNKVNAYTHDPGVMPVFLDNDNYKPFRENKDAHVFSFYYSNSVLGYLYVESASGSAMNVFYELINTDGSGTSGSASDNSGVQNNTTSPILVTAENGSSALKYSSLPTSSKDYSLLLSSAQGANVIAAYEIDAGEESSFPLDISFHLGKAYVGDRITILHKTKSGKVERYVCVVDKDGVAKITVNELSPFMLVRDDVNAVSASPSVPATGDMSICAHLCLLICVFYLSLIALKLKRS